MNRIATGDGSLPPSRFTQSRSSPTSFCPPLADFNGILIGSAVYNHDAVLNAGILEWGYRSLWTSGLHVFDWPAGFPLKNGLAGTENLLGWQLIYSPMRAIGLDRSRELQRHDPFFPGHFRHIRARC